MFYTGNIDDLRRVVKGEFFVSVEGTGCWERCRIYFGRKGRLWR
jgi:hypothetical protein